jgi:hypothetical protein
MKLASNTNQTVVEDAPVHSSLASTNQTVAEEGSLRPKIASNIK